MINFAHFQTFPKIHKKGQKFQPRVKIPKVRALAVMWIAIVASQATG